MRCDAIVIGAGVNGLAAAVHLSAKGWKVAVVERSAIAGGAVKTGEITLSGFRHDLYAMNLSLFAGSPFYAAHRERLANAGLEFVAAERTFATAFSDGSWLGVERNLQATADRIAALHAGDAQRWRRMVADFGTQAPHIFALLGAPMPSLAALRVLYRAWRAGGSAMLARLTRLVLASPRDWLNENFAHEKLKAMMAVWGMHLDFSPGVAGGALFPYLESMANQAFGLMLGKNGADIIISAMVPSEPVLVVGQPTAVDPGRAPPGRHILWVQVRALPATIAGDALGHIAATDWDVVKEPYADRVIDLIERYAPGTRTRILARAVLSPKDLERDNPNLVDGDSLSGSHHLDQNFFFRPAFGFSRYRTAIPRLYMVGASTWPGAGTGAGSGFMLAEALAGR